MVEPELPMSEADDGEFVGEILHKEAKAQAAEGRSNLVEGLRGGDRKEADDACSTACAAGKQRC